MFEFPTEADPYIFMMKKVICPLKQSIEKVYEYSTEADSESLMIKKLVCPLDQSIRKVYVLDFPTYNDENRCPSNQSSSKQSFDKPLKKNCPPKVNELVYRLHK